MISLHVVKCLPNFDISKGPSLQRNLRFSLTLVPVVDKNVLNDKVLGVQIDINMS